MKLRLRLGICPSNDLPGSTSSTSSGLAVPFQLAGDKVALKMPIQGTPSASQSPQRPLSFHSCPGMLPWPLIPSISLCPTSPSGDIKHRA